MQLCRFTNNILSTAQQIWLQKLGGAKNPVSRFTENTSWDELPNTQKLASKAQKSVFGDEAEKINSSKEVQADETGKVNSSPEVKAKSGGLRPGERYIASVPLTFSMWPWPIFMIL